MKMPRLKGIMAIRSDLKDAIKFDVDALSIAGHFGKEVAANTIAKIARRSTTPN